MQREKFKAVGHAVRVRARDDEATIEIFVTPEQALRLADQLTAASEDDTVSILAWKSDGQLQVTSERKGT